MMTTSGSSDDAPPAQPQEPRTGTSPRSRPALRLVSIVVRAGVVVCVLALSVTVFTTLVKMRVDPAQTPREELTLSVVTVQASLVGVPRVYEGFGTVRAMDQADLSAQVSARVTERPEGIEAGATVAEGDLIVALESIDFELRAEASRQAIAGLRAELDSLAVDRERLGDRVELSRQEVAVAQREYERFLDAQSQSVANQIELDARLTALRRAERELTGILQQREQLPAREAQLLAREAGERANLQLAEANLARTRIVAPFAGVLQSVAAEEGELLNIGSPVARLVALGRVEVPLSLPAGAVAQVPVGARVELRPDAETADRVWTGTVARVSPESDASTRTGTVFVEIAQDADDRVNALLPGRFVAARVFVERDTPRVIVPRRAVVDDLLAIAEFREKSTDRDGSAAAAEFTNGGPAWRVHRVPVRVEHFLNASFPSLHPRESEWAVLVADHHDLADATVVITNIDQLTEGLRLEPAPTVGTVVDGQIVGGRLRIEDGARAGPKPGVGGASLSGGARP